MKARVSSRVSREMYALCDNDKMPLSIYARFVSFLRMLLNDKVELSIEECGYRVKLKGTHVGLIPSRR